MNEKHLWFLYKYSIYIIFSYLQCGRVNAVSWMNDNENKITLYSYYMHFIMFVVLYGKPKLRK